MPSARDEPHPAPPARARTAPGRPAPAYPGAPAGPPPPASGPARRGSRGGSPREPGRPKTAEEVRALVLKLATENGWGYTRVLGELKNLGVAGVSRTTVKNILKTADIDPGP
ncbi:MAG: helix-turn-helix domain-containing protein [Planctomycetes bacterium]|nr:helix-turn-helix domain-containing protein [Planctomycetota bacterium]